MVAAPTKTNIDVLQNALDTAKTYQDFDDSDEFNSSHMSALTLESTLDSERSDIRFSWKSNSTRKIKPTKQQETKKAMPAVVEVLSPPASVASSKSKSLCRLEQMCQQLNIMQRKEYRNSKDIPATPLWIQFTGWTSRTFCSLKQRYSTLHYPHCEKGNI